MHVRRVDGVVVVALAGLGGALTVLAPVCTMVAVVGVIWAIRRRCARATLGLALVVFGIQAWRARAALNDADRPPSALRERELVVEVATSPVIVTERGEADQARLDATATATGERLRLYGMPNDACRGDQFRIVARLGPRRRFQQVGGRDARVALALRPYRASGSVRQVERLRRGHGLGAAIDRLRARVRQRIKATYPPAAVPMARALVLGEQAMDVRDADAFRSSGLSHLLAVSGSHLVIAVVALAQLVRALLVRLPWLAARFDVGRVVAIFTIVMSWLYADFAGGGGSAYRAAAMLSVANLARAQGWRAPTERSFGWSMLLGGFTEPLAVLDVSFALSAAATAGLLAARGSVQSLHRRLRPGPGRWLIETGLATTSATLACAPLLLLMGPQLPVLGVVANAVAGPIGEVVALPLSLAHCLVAPWPAAEKGMAAVAGGALLAVRAIAHATAASSWATASLPPPSAAQLAVLAVGAAWFWSSRRRAWCVGLVLLALMGFEVAQRRPPRGELRITVLDVGQGDAIWVDLPDGRLMLVDGGGLVGSPIDVARRVLLPELRRRRRHHIDVVVLSHAHPDHYGGLVTLLREVPVRELWDPSPTVPGSLWHRARSRLRAHGTAIVGTDALCGRPHRFADAVVRVLAPCPSRDLWASENDNSVVLHLRLARHSALLVGDAEAHEEESLLARGVPRADLLKVGHHGSRTSTSPAFVAAVRPVAAVISRGVRNRFGHPHPETLATLRSVVVADTALDGGVTWATDGAHMTLRRARDDPSWPWRSRSRMLVERPLP